MNRRAILNSLSGTNSASFAPIDDPTKAKITPITAIFKLM